MIIKYAIANVKIGDIALMAQDSGLDGSVYQGYGFGAWGVEPTAFIEMAVEDSAHVDHFIRAVLFRFSEKCAYRTVDGKDAGLLYVDGRLEAIA